MMPESLAQPRAYPEEAGDSVFLALLVGIIRADDTYGGYERKSDIDLLAPFVLSRGARKALPMCGNPDGETIHRVEQFYRTVTIAVERRTGLMASSMVSLHPEGFGRVVIIVGKLVAYEKTLRDVHRFGFDGIEGLALAGANSVAQAVATIEAYPEVARA